jgi:hypothetical protein
MSRLTLTLNSHALTDFQTCAQRYWFTQEESLVQLATHKPFETGTAIHNAIRHMNRAQIRRPGLTANQKLTCGLRALSRTKWWKSMPLMETKESGNAPTQLFHMTKLTQYAAWRAQKSWLRVLGAEVGFSKVLYEDRDVMFVYEGTIDDISEFTDDGRTYRCWVDYKTEGRETKHFTERNQFLGYSWALGTNYGFIISYGLQKEKAEPFRYESVYHGPKLLEQWKNDTIRTFREIINKVPFGRTEFRRNRSACDSGHFGVCPYLRLCDNNWESSAIRRGIRRAGFQVREHRSW